MAKIYGINGNISGKQGNNVFAILRGETILRKYQPIVANPNTQAQVSERAKFKVASQLSSIIPAAILSGMAPMARAKKIALRNVFSSMNLKAGVWTYSDNMTVADYLAMQFSQGNLNKGSAAGLDFEESLEASFTYSNPAVAAMGGINKILPFAFSPAMKQFYVGEMKNISEGSGIIEFPAAWAGVNVHVFCYAIHSSSEAAGVRYTSAFNSAMFSVTTEFLQAAGAMEYSPTLYIGSGTIS